MQQIGIKKVVVNIGVGSPGKELRNAKELLQRITGEKPIRTKAEEKIPDFGIRPGLEVGCMVTLRGKKAGKILNKFLGALEELKNKQISPGTMSFGIKEYIEIPRVEYDPEIGMFGMDVSVVLEKPGNQKISKAETIRFFEDNFEVEVKG